MFPIIHSLTTTTKAVRMATKDVIKEFSDDRVVYLELRSTPRACPGMSKEQYIAAIIDGMIEGSEEFEIMTRLLLSIDRRQSVEDAEQTVKLAAADKSGLIAGVELSGDPSIDGRKFLPILQQARDFGLKVAVHLAEVTTQLEEVHDFLAFRPDRIGHGTFLHIHEAFVNSVIQQRIPLGK
ncbi:unnamed protein product [Angiostrongylus costaricensis]|uniref:A_deaminase domain-containing protein n=1 Tax=Angiostrongylus costaricensis TaxID=334426 RepID=A0A0R3PPM2_ANGCS|nr:unnamed protein product [Angiostrongylus costaricensis]